MAEPSWRDKDPLEYTPEEEYAAQMERERMTRGAAQDLPGPTRKFSQLLTPEGEAYPSKKPKGPEVGDYGPSEGMPEPPLATIPGSKPTGAPRVGGGGGIAGRLERAGKFSMDPVVIVGADAVRRTTGTALNMIMEKSRQREFLSEAYQNRMDVAMEARAQKQQEMEALRTEMDAKEADLQISAQYANRPDQVGIEELKNLQMIARGENPEGGLPITPEEQRKAQRQLNKFSQVDPRGRMSAGRRVMAAIGMALGAYASAITKTPNYAMQIVREAINQDVAEQRAKFERAKGKVSDLRSSFQLARQSFKDELAQMDAAMAIDMQKASFAMKQLAAESQDINTMTQLQDMAFQADQEVAKLMGQAKDREMRGLIAAGEMRLKGAELAMRQMAAKMKGAPPKEIESAAAMSQLRDKLLRLRQRWKEKIEGRPSVITGKNPFTATEEELFDQEAAKLSRWIVTQKEGKRFSDKDWEFVQQFVMPKAHSFWGGDWSEMAYQKMDDMISGIDRELIAKQRAYGTEGPPPATQQVLPTAGEAQ